MKRYLGEAPSDATPVAELVAPRQAVASVTLQANAPKEIETTYMRPRFLRNGEEGLTSVLTGVASEFSG